MRRRKLSAATRNRELALQAARETITLLKNDGGLLRLIRRNLTIAVIGPNAHRSCWAVTAAFPSTM
jgi:beta-glucosidase